MFRHIDARPTKGDAFHFEAHALLEGAVAAGLYLSTGAQHAIPRQRPAAFAQHRRYLAMAAGIAGDGRYLAVSRHLAAWNHCDGATDRLFGLRWFRSHSPTAYWMRRSPLVRYNSFSAPLCASLKNHL